MTLAPELEAIVRAQAFFSDYAFLVRDWEVRPHQRPWFSALQALADGWLRHPDSGHCDKCREIENRWITERFLPLDLGYQARCGKCKTTNKLLILAFFGSGKSDTVAEWLEWLIGRSIIDGIMPKCGLTSYADAVAGGRSVGIRDTIGENACYRAIFPDARPAKGKSWSESEWYLKRKDPGKKDPTLLAAGWDGSFFSYRFSTAIVVDDPADPKQMRSPTYKEDRWNTWRTTVRSRAAQGRTPIVFISNRFADDDLPGRLMKREGDWFVITTPALDEFFQTVWPEEVVDGEPMGISTEALLKMQEEDPDSFRAGYMCVPPSHDGGLFQAFSIGPEPNHSDVVKVVQFWDTATTNQTYSDHNAMAEWWHLKNGRSYLARMVVHKTKDVTEYIIDEFNRSEKEFTTYVPIENGPGGAGAIFVNNLQRYSGVRVRLHNIGGFGKGSGVRGPRDMISRCYGVKDRFDMGDAFIPNKYEPWLEDFVAEMRAMAPGATNTDRVSAAVGGLEYIYPARAIGRPHPNWTLAKV